MNGDSKSKALTASNWIALAVVFLMSMGIIAALVQSRLKPIEDKISELETLQDKYNHLLAEVAADHAERKSKEIEIETQFNADGQLRNVQFSDQQRMNCIFWSHIPELGSYPTGPFYQPNISQQARP